MRTTFGGHSKGAALPARVGPARPSTARTAPVRAYPPPKSVPAVRHGKHVGPSWEGGPVAVLVVGHQLAVASNTDFSAALAPCFSRALR